MEGKEGVNDGRIEGIFLKEVGGAGVEDAEGNWCACVWLNGCDVHKVLRRSLPPVW